jgi:hypothetical protein
MDYLLTKKNYPENLIELLSNEDDRSIRFIIEYIYRDKNIDTFLPPILQQWNGIFDYIAQNMDHEKIDNYLKIILESISIDDVSLLNQNNALTQHISSMSKFIAFVKNIYSNEDHIFNFLSILKPKFDYLECPSEEAELFNKICEQSYFAFNPDMLLQIILLNADNADNEKIKSNFKIKPYTIAQKFAPLYLKEQIANSIDNFFDKIIKLEKSIQEEEPYFIDLLNNSDLDIQNKLWLLKHNQTKIDNISDITEQTLWKSVFEHNKITANWDSIIKYSALSGYILNNILTNYINDKENCIHLYSLELPTITENSSSLFIHSILESNTLNDQIYTKIIQEIKHNYHSLDVSNLNISKVQLLINFNVLVFNNDNIASIQQYHPTLLDQFININLNQYYTKLGIDIVLEPTKYELLLISEKLDTAQKYEIIKNLGINFYQKSDKKYYINKIFNENDKTLPIEYIKAFLNQASISIEEKLRLLIAEIPHLAHTEITECLDTLKSPYRSLSTPKHHRLDYNDINDNLTLALKNKNYINRLQTYEKKGEKSTITFTTK